MPAPDNRSKPSWADQVEEGENEVSVTLPTVSESLDDKGSKTVVEYKTIVDKKVKIIRVYRVETHLVSKSIAERKTWKKFGDAFGDPAGPNPSNTIVAEDVFMQFITNKESMQEKQNTEGLLKNAKDVTCRLCHEYHWTRDCPYRSTLEPLQETLKNEDKNKAAGGAGASSSAADDKKLGGRYVPPNMREGGNRRGESMQSSTREEYTIRVTNLSEDVVEKDLQDLFKPFGTILRHYLAIDKTTQQSKGFAFVTFTRKEDAAKAIAAVSGYGYDHLILNVEWAKPPAQ